jgi:hypothetical protein
MENVDRLEKARAITNIGLHDGLPHWAFVLELQRSRLLQLQVEGRRLMELMRSPRPPSDWPEQAIDWQSQLLADGHFLLIAVRHVLQLARHLRDYTAAEDHRAEVLFEAFVKGRHRRAEQVRDILEHFDQYWVVGKREPRKGMSGWPRPIQANFGGGELYLRVGQNKLELFPLADDALELTRGLYEVWAEVTPPAIMSENPYDPPDFGELVIVADEPGTTEEPDDAP